MYSLFVCLLWCSLCDVLNFYNVSVTFNELISFLLYTQIGTQEEYTLLLTYNPEPKSSLNRDKRMKPLSYPPLHGSIVPFQYVNGMLYCQRYAVYSKFKWCVSCLHLLLLVLFIPVVVFFFFFGGVNKLMLMISIS